MTGQQRIVNVRDVPIACHGRLSPTGAVQMAEELAEFDVFFFEEPV